MIEKKTSPKMEVKKMSQSIPGIERVWFFFNVYVVISIKIVCARACLRDRETQTDRNIEKGDRKIESDVGVIT